MSRVCPGCPQTTPREAREASCIRDAYGENPKSKVQGPESKVCGQKRGSAREELVCRQAAQHHINATSKPPQSLLVANRLRPTSQLQAILMRPSSHLHATFMRPQSHPRRFWLRRWGYCSDAFGGATGHSHRREFPRPMTKEWGEGEGEGSPNNATAAVIIPCPWPPCG